MNKAWLILIWLLLTACQPKGSYLYHSNESVAAPIARVMVVMDYLNLKDDLGQQWDFDSDHHQQLLNRLLGDTNHLLRQWGYPKVEQYLLTSGLLFRQPIPVDHYRQQQLQANPLYPPYLLASNGTEKVMVHQDVLQLLVKYIAPRRHHADESDSMRGMHVGHQFQSLSIPQDTAVLYVHINQSAAGLIKQLSSLILAAAVASQTDHTQIYLDAGHQRQASAFLIDSTGLILWKNHSLNWHPGLPMQQLLAEFPRRAVDQPVNDRY